MSHLGPARVKTSEGGDFISRAAAQIGELTHSVPAALWHRPVLSVRVYQKLRLFVRPLGICSQGKRIIEDAGNSDLNGRMVFPHQPLMSAGSLLP